MAISQTELAARRLLKFILRPPNPYLRLSELAFYRGVRIRGLWPPR